MAGWLGYSAVGITINRLGGAPLAPLLVGHTCFVLCGIGLTHLLRREIHRRRSPMSPISRLWPLLTLGAVAISVVLAALVISVNRLLTDHQWELIAVVALWWGMFVATGAWILLYVRFSERRSQEVREGELNRVLREAHLAALEGQMNPHFLFNALNSIRALVELDPPRARDMLTRLCNVLRNTLRRDSEHTVPLEIELEAISDYLELESVRFSDRLRSSVVADADTAECRVPPMLLQTLVENAVKHGVASSKGCTDLSIRATIDEKNLRIAVANTGQLLEAPENGIKVGLKNTKERLKLLYGDRARLCLEEKAGLVVATVTIPVTGHEDPRHSCG